MRMLLRRLRLPSTVPRAPLVVLVAHRLGWQRRHQQKQRQHDRPKVAESMPRTTPLTPRWRRIGRLRSRRNQVQDRPGRGRELGRISTVARNLPATRIPGPRMPGPPVLHARHHQRLGRIRQVLLPRRTMHLRVLGEERAVAAPTKHMWPQMTIRVPETGPAGCR